MPIRAAIGQAARDAATAALPLSLRLWLRGVQRKLKLQSVPVGKVDFGSLRRLDPISPIFGKDRDLVSIERHYIESFLEAHSVDIKGRVLELGDPSYTERFGGSRVTTADVLHYVPGNPQATIVGDFTRPETIPVEAFDCMIVTQTLQMIYDVRPAIRTLHDALKPGGVLLCTSHGISPIARREGVDDWGEYWHFTSQSIRRLFEEVFPRESLEIRTYGNIFTVIGSLHGLAAQEVLPEELDYCDPKYELIVAVRAQRPR